MPQNIGMDSIRHLTPLDRLLAGAQNALETVLGQPAAERANPGLPHPDVVMN